MTGSAAILGDANEGVIPANGNDSTGVGLIHQQGTLSDDQPDDGAGMTDNETPTTDTIEGSGAGGVVVENLGQCCAGITVEVCVNHSARRSTTCTTREPRRTSSSCWIASTCSKSTGLQM